MWFLLGSFQYNIIERRILYCMRDLVKELEQAVYNFDYRDYLEDEVDEEE